MTERCETCRYLFEIKGEPCKYACRRFPENVRKLPEEWCGEWRERDPQPWDVEQR